MGGSKTTEKPKYKVRFLLEKTHHRKELIYSLTEFQKSECLNYENYKNYLSKTPAEVWSALGPEGSIDKKIVRKVYTKTKTNRKRLKLNKINIDDDEDIDDIKNSLFNKLKQKHPSIKPSNIEIKEFFDGKTVTVILKLSDNTNTQEIKNDK